MEVKNVLDSAGLRADDRDVGRTCVNNRHSNCSASAMQHDAACCGIVMIFSSVTANEEDTSRKAAPGELRCGFVARIQESEPRKSKLKNIDRSGRDEIAGVIET